MPSKLEKDFDRNFAMKFMQFLSDFKREIQAVCGHNIRWGELEREVIGINVMLSLTAYTEIDNGSLDKLKELGFQYHLSESWTTFAVFDFVTQDLGAFTEVLAP